MYLFYIIVIAEHFFLLNKRDSGNLRKNNLFIIRMQTKKCL